MPRWLRPVVAIGLLVLATLLSRFGLVDLIKRGYGTVTWGFWVVFVGPVLTWGAWRVFTTKSSTE